MPSKKDVRPRLSGRASAGGIALAVLLAALASNQLRSLGTPLLWNDEAHTVMTGKFTLQYGYPRVTDGRNTVYAGNIVDGVYANFDEELQATTHSVWLLYYYAAFAVWLADFATDIHTRTLILRACFALVGLAGIILFWRALAFRLRGTGDERTFGLAFLLLMLLSVSLVLHLREVRYYSLNFFQGGLLLYLYVRWRSELPRFRLRWFVGIAACMAATFLTFYPVYFIFVASIGLVEGLILLAALPAQPGGPDLVGRFRAALLAGLRAASPVLVSFLIVLPTFGYFEPFAKGEGKVSWLANLGIVFTFLARYEFLVPLLVASGIVVALLVQARRRGDLRAQLHDPRLSTAAFLLVALLAYAGIVTRMPEPNFIFTRYYILLIPLVSATGVLQLLWVRATLRGQGRGPALTRFAVALVVAGTLPSLGAKLETWQGRLLELRRPVRGPLDFAIPYLLERFEGGAHDLVLATNYEEPVFMYYLDCKVIVGYVPTNLAGDLTHAPDVIVFRKAWGTHAKIFREMLARHDHEKVSFPVQDYPVNHIPQFERPIPHQFETLLTDDPRRRFSLHVRRDAGAPRPSSPGAPTR